MTKKNEQTNEVKPKGKPGRKPGTMTQAQKDHMDEARKLALGQKDELLAALYLDSAVKEGPWKRLAKDDPERLLAISKVIAEVTTQAKAARVAALQAEIANLNGTPAPAPAPEATPAPVQG